MGKVTHRKNNVEWKIGMQKLIEKCMGYWMSGAAARTGKL